LTGLLAINLWPNEASAHLDRSTECATTMVANTGEGSLTAAGSNACNGMSIGSGGSAQREPTVRYVDCGPPTVVGRQEPIGTSMCGSVHLMCNAEVRSLLPLERVVDLLEIDTYPGGRQVRTTHCRVPGPKSARPQVTGAMARQEAEKLLPHPAIGVAPAGGVTLVNIETVLWVDTPVDRTLGTVTLLGHRVTLRAHIERVHWNFGDDSTEATTTPGKAYTNADPCRTVDCPDYFGHTYLHTGPLTITAQVTWTGQFRVDDGPWQSIPGTVTAAATSTGIHVKEARGILVPNPSSGPGN
jgi:hypothetical protein